MLLQYCLSASECTRNASFCLFIGYWSEFTCHGFLHVCMCGVMRVKQWLCIGVSQSQEWQQEKSLVLVWVFQHSFGSLSEWVLEQNPYPALNAIYLVWLWHQNLNRLAATLQGYVFMSLLVCASDECFFGKTKNNVYICIWCMFLFIG